MYSFADWVFQDEIGIDIVHVYFFIGGRFILVVETIKRDVV